MYVDFWILYLVKIFFQNIQSKLLYRIYSLSPRKRNLFIQHFEFLWSFYILIHLDFLFAKEVNFLHKQDSKFVVSMYTLYKPWT